MHVAPGAQIGVGAGGNNALLQMYPPHHTW